ncbi:permease for cytosine/purines, uracil, thiamine, allantoin-domain-containing protein [Lipomyces tetrasporus]
MRSTMDKTTEDVYVQADQRETGIVLEAPSSVWGRILRKIELKSEVEAGRRSNPDLDPVPPEGRHWHAQHYALFWISDNVSVSGFRTASSIMDVGLSWRMSLLCVALANLLAGMVVTLNGIVGTDYHIPFSIQSRASFGYYLSYLMILMRCIVGIFWYGIQTYTGAECVQTMLYAIWPSFRNVPNTLPSSANINTQLMTAYVIYFVTMLPFHYVGIHKVKWLFLLKTVSTFVVGFGLMGWTINTVGVNNTSLFNQGNKVHGSGFTWVFLNSFYSNLGGFTTLMVNAPDYSRYAHRRRSTYITLFAVPFTATLVTFMGVVVAAGSNVMYGEILWDPLQVLDKWTSKGGRAAAFFCALSFYFSQLGLNIAANSLASANDMNAIWPKYINLRRGQFIAAFLGAWVLTPWNIMTSAPAFLNFMSGYSIWLGPLCGVLIADYFIVHRRKYDVNELYKFGGIYNYHWGCNWRAFAAFTIAWVPLLPGFIPTVTSGITASTGVTHLYDLGFFYGFGSAILCYSVICHFFPARETYVDAVYPDDNLDDTTNIEFVVSEEVHGEKLQAN